MMLTADRWQANTSGRSSSSNILRVDPKFIQL